MHDVAPERTGTDITANRDEDMFMRGVYLPIPYTSETFAPRIAMIRDGQQSRGGGR